MAMRKKGWSLRNKVRECGDPGKTIYFRENFLSRSKNSSDTECRNFSSKILL